MHLQQPTDDFKGLAAEMLTYAVGQLFPNVLFASSGVLKHGFYCDFIFEQPIYSEMLSLIDTNLRSSLKDAPEVHIRSMMRENASSLLEHHQQPHLADIIAGDQTNIIDLVQIGDHYGLCLSPLNDPALIGAARVLEMEEVLLEGDMKVTRLIGAAFEDSQKLKDFVKLYNALLKKKDHRILGPKHNLFFFDPAISEAEPFWLPDGVQYKHILIEWLESKLQSTNFLKVETPLGTDRVLQHIYLINKLNIKRPVFEYEKKYQEVPDAEKWGLFNNNSYLSDLMTFRCSKKEVVDNVISSLQFIEQTIRIFGFEAHWHLIASKQRTQKANKEIRNSEFEIRKIIDEVVRRFSFSYPFISEIQEEQNSLGPRLELRLIDEIGREWPSAAITFVLQDSADDIFIARSFWGSLERFIALLLERNVFLENIRSILKGNY